jgi:small subunit ribosomal protein S17
MSETTSHKRTLVGRVVSDRMEKTVTVIVERRVKHAMYNKIIVRSSKYHAHNDNNEAKGRATLVEIQESRPLSKTKTWVVTKLAGTCYRDLELAFVAKAAIISLGFPALDGISNVERSSPCGFQD